MSEVVAQDSTTESAGALSTALTGLASQISSVLDEVANRNRPANHWEFRVRTEQNNKDRDLIFGLSRGEMQKLASDPTKLDTVISGLQSVREEADIKAQEKKMKELRAELQKVGIRSTFRNYPVKDGVAPPMQDDTIGFFPFSSERDRKKLSDGFKEKMTTINNQIQSITSSTQGASAEMADKVLDSASSSTIAPTSSVQPTIKRQTGVMI